LGGMQVFDFAYKNRPGGRKIFLAIGDPAERPDSSK
jgi:hypothetical protein